MKVCWLCLESDEKDQKVSRFWESALCNPCDKLVHDELLRLGLKGELQDWVWCKSKKENSAAAH